MFYVLVCLNIVLKQFSIQIIKIHHTDILNPEKYYFLYFYNMRFCSEIDQEEKEKILHEYVLSMLCVGQSENTIVRWRKVPA